VNVVAIKGSGGGVGVTTIVAQLTAQLTAQHRRALAFDFSPSNVLRLHFGMPWSDDTGLAPQVLSGKPWHKAAFRSAGAIDFVPFGRVNGGMTTSDFSAFLNRDKEWFANRIKELDMPPDSLVICDCPAAEEILQAQVMSTARLALVVVAPDAISYASATIAVETALFQGAGEVFLLLNGFDSTRALDRDISLLLHNESRYRFVPVTIHRDEHLREAVACKQTVLEYAPASRAAYDFDALAAWLYIHLSQVKSGTS
jgi:cellulose synthase operon protein YhjQ